MTCKRTDKGFEIEVHENGKVIARLVMHIFQDALFPHTEFINVWTPRTLRLFRRAIELVKVGAKGKYTKFMTSAYYDDDLPKREKYWRVMGFDKFGDSEYEGRKLRIAWMEI